MKVLARLLPPAVLALLVSATGCVIADLRKVRETEQKAAEYAYLEGGICFLEPYDPDKILVLFVHGAPDYPKVFAALVQNLDRTRFQPWLFY